MDKKKSFQFFTDIAYNQPMDFIASERKITETNNFVGTQNLYE